MNVIKAEIFNLESFQKDYEKFDDNDEESQNAILESLSSYLGTEEVLAITSDDLFSVVDDGTIDYKSLEDKFYGIVNSMESSSSEDESLIAHQNEFGTKVINDQYDGIPIVLFINPEADTYTLFMTTEAFQSLFPNSDK